MSINQPRGSNGKMGLSTKSQRHPVLEVGGTGQQALEQPNEKPGTLVLRLT